MTFAPQTLRDLAAYWIGQGGVNLGIVGDASHLAKGVSYHLGKDDLLPGAYSAERPRDKAGLTDAASAIDLGKLGGSYGNLRSFSDWLARRCVAGDPGTGDVVEVIYSPDGQRVLGYKQGVAYLIPNYGDPSHLTHTHVSYFRDSEKRDKRPLFEQYFLPDSSTVDDMPGMSLTNLAASPGTLRVKGTGHSFIYVDGSGNVAVPDGWPGVEGHPVIFKAVLKSDFTLKTGGVIKAGTPVFVTGGDESAFLAADVTFTAAPADKHTIVTEVDGNVVLDLTI
jgi:hypothetical protein